MELMQSNGSWNIGQLCQYIEAKWALSLYEGVLFNALSNWISFYLSSFNGRDGAEAWTGATVPE